MAGDEYVEVAIHGQKLRYRSKHGRAYAEQLAALVRDRIDEAMEQARTVAVDRAAVIAALRFADDYLQLKQQVERERAENDEQLAQRLNRLLQTADQMLDP